MPTENYTDGTGSINVIFTGTGIQIKDGGIALGSNTSAPATPVSGAISGATLVSPVIQNAIVTSAPVVIAVNTALTAALHAGKTVVTNKIDGITITLPAATGTGNKYRVIVGATLTSNSLVAAVASATDYMRGFALLANDTDGSASNFETANTGTLATESDTITLNRTTTGIATIGDTLEFEDIRAAVWSVRVYAQANGTEATPFTVAV